MWWTSVTLPCCSPKKYFSKVRKSSIFLMSIKSLSAKVPYYAPFIDKLSLLHWRTSSILLTYLLLFHYILHLLDWRTSSPSFTCLFSFCSFKVPVSVALARRSIVYEGKKKIKIAEDSFFFLVYQVLFLNWRSKNSV